MDAKGDADWLRLLKALGRSLLYMDVLFESGGTGGFMVYEVKVRRDGVQLGRFRVMVKGVTAEGPGIAFAEGSSASEAFKAALDGLRAGVVRVHEDAYPPNKLPPMPLADE